MTYVDHRRVARKGHTCNVNRIDNCRSIKPGDVYVETTAFPGDEWGFAHEGKPVRLACCAPCHLDARLGDDRVIHPIPYEQLAWQGLL